MVEKAKYDAARLKKNDFRQRFEATYGVSFESKCDYDYMYVTKKTIEKTETECHVESALLTAATTALGFIPGIRWYVVAGVTAGAWGFTEFANKPYSYEQYIVDVGKIYNWQRNPATGEWEGLARGEHLVFNINSDGTLEYKGHVDFASHACTYPIEQPCYFYYTTAANVGVYRYDFDWGNIPLINPFRDENP